MHVVSNTKHDNMSRVSTLSRSGVASISAYTALISSATGVIRGVYHHYKIGGRRYMQWRLSLIIEHVVSSRAINDASGALIAKRRRSCQKYLRYEGAMRREYSMILTYREAP